MTRAVLASAVIAIAGILAAATHPTTRPATATSAPTTTSAPAPKNVRWMQSYDAAVAEARKSSKLLLAVYFDVDSPAWEMYERATLSDRTTRQFLADFTAVKLDVARGDGKKRFAATGAKETPLTQVLTPKGELLDSIPGCVLPAKALREQLALSQDYWRAVNARPFTTDARWQAAASRSLLSTGHKAVKDIDALGKLAPDKLPAGVSKAGLLVMKGNALAAKPDQAQKHYAEAYRLAPDDEQVGGAALVARARAMLELKQYPEAHKLCVLYIDKFPNSADIWPAYLLKVITEYQGLDNRAAAVGTLKTFIEKYPDNPDVVEAKQYLKAIE